MISAFWMRYEFAMPRLGYEISVSGRNDGTLEAAYIRFKTTKVHRTVEVIEDSLLADYDRKRDLVGIEILAPVRLTDLTRLVDRDRRADFRRFARQAMPHELVAA